MKGGTQALLIWFWMLGVSLACVAQTPVAPTPETAGPVRGDDWQGYNVINSFEAGYRFATVSGNDAQYDSNENFQDGVRLFSSFFSLNSKTGTGNLFDELIVSTNGLGGDPQSAASVRVDKNRIYEYSLLWREDEYFNPGLTTDGAAGQHLTDMSYILQDHSLVLFPQSELRFTLGYSRNSQAGTGISTVQVSPTGTPFDSTGSIFPLFADIKRIQNTYRLGGELHIFGFALTAEHGWEDYKEDTPYTLVPSLASSGFTLTSLSRTEPYHGTSPFWNVGLFRNSNWFDINSRFTYTSGEREFFVNELASGIAPVGNLSNQQIFSFGDARRPVATGNLNMSVRPMSRLTISEHTSLYNVRTEGDSTYLQFDNASQTADFFLFDLLKIRTFEAGADALYKLANWLDLHAGYDYSDRRILASPQIAFVGDPASAAYEQTNILQSGSFGLRIRPIKKLTITADDEIGSANRPFTPKSDRNFNAIAARAQYQVKSLQFSAWSTANYNANSITLTSYSSHERTNAVSGTWTPRPWFSLDTSYSKLHVDTLGGIAFFANTEFFPSEVSYYVSNLHVGTLYARVGVKRVDVFAGFSRVQDTGDGRSSPLNTNVGPAIPGFQVAQTFPLKFQSPSCRISVRIHERLRWNIGFQYYGYREDFFEGENYHANTGYTSLLWSF